MSLKILKKEIPDLTIRELFMLKKLTRTDGWLKRFILDVQKEIFDSKLSFLTNKANNKNFNKNNYLIYIAKDNDEIVGWSLVTTYKQHTSPLTSSNGNIQIFVKKSHRKQKIASKLLNNLIKDYKKNNKNKTLEAFPCDIAGNKFFTTHGFKQAEKFDWSFLKHI